MLASLFPWLLYLVAWLMALFSYSSTGLPLWAALFAYVVLLNGGIQGLWAAVWHLCFPKKTAKKIGWQTNGFQTEVGGTNLAIGIVSILAFWNTEWLIPAGLMTAIFYLVCVYGHIRDRVIHKNKSPCNSGPMLYSSIAIVATLLFCIGMSFFVST